LISNNVPFLIMLTTRLRLQQLRVAVEAFAFIGLAVAIVDRERQIMAANHLMEAMLDQVKWLPGNRIALVDPKANAQFDQALSDDSSRAFPARACNGKTVIVHVMPSDGQQGELFDGLAILAVTIIDSKTAPDTALIRALYDLSAGEARVARGLTRGQTVDEIATTAGVSPETVRSQVKAVLAKTGTRRQAEATALLAGLQKLPLR
jgi:DNA-binding CsgD family transcriptional regulator